MNSLWTLCWVNSVTVFLGGGLRWETGEMCSDCKNTHIHKQIYLGSPLIFSHSLIPSVNSSDRMHIRVGVFSISVFVCVYSFASYKRRRLRQTLLPSLKYEEKETRRIEFDWTWITEHYLNVTQDKRSGCDPTLGSWLHAERCLLHAGNAQCYSGSSFVLVWAFYFWQENLCSDSNQPFFWSQSGACRPVTVLAE